MNSSTTPSNPTVLQKLYSLRKEMASRAQEEYDAWEQDENGEDPELGTGGICDRIADALLDVISDHGLQADTWGFNDHAWVVVTEGEEEISVDIPAHVYERGCGYVWKKIPGVVFTEEHLVIG